MKSLQQQEELLSDHIANQRRLMEQRQAEVQKKQSIEAKRLQKMNAKLDQERTEMLILKEAGNFDDNNSTFKIEKLRSQCFDQPSP